jgi:hypothetical protein
MIVYDYAEFLKNVIDIELSAVNWIKINAIYLYTGTTV